MARANWYRYYAGYSTQFVRDVLDHLDLPKRATVLDPWNGSGTTTATASEAGFGVTGYDANPALVIVALARQLDVGISKSLNALTADLLKHARQEGSAIGLRAIERRSVSDRRTRPEHEGAPSLTGPARRHRWMVSLDTPASTGRVAQQGTECSFAWAHACDRAGADLAVVSTKS
jgi:hypothetical protein